MFQKDLGSNYSLTDRINTVVRDFASAIYPADSNVKQILSEAIAFHGGPERMKAFSSYVLTAEYNSFDGLVIKFKMDSSKNKLTLMNYVNRKRKEASFCQKDGANTKEISLSNVLAKTYYLWRKIRREAMPIYFLPLLYFWNQRYQARYIGKESVNGTECSVIEYITKYLFCRLFLKEKTYQVLKISGVSIGSMVNPWENEMFEHEFVRFRKVRDLLLPHLIELSFGEKNIGRVVIESILFKKGG